MKKVILLGIIAVVFAFTSNIRAEMSLSGYQEFFAGAVDQSIYQGLENNSDQDVEIFNSYDRYLLNPVAHPFSGA